MAERVNLNMKVPPALLDEIDEAVRLANKDGDGLDSVSRTAYVMTAALKKARADTARAQKAKP